MYFYEKMTYNTNEKSSQISSDMEKHFTNRWISVDNAHQLAEEKVLARLRSGDYSIREELFNLYFDRLYSLIFNSVGRDKMAAEDITQETFLNVLSSLKSFDSKSKLYTWIVGIARHKIVDYYRTVKKEREQESYRLGNSDPNIISDDVPAADALESIETGVTVRKALSDLDPKYQQVLLLKYVEDMSVVEISQIMGRSPKSVEGLLTRARNALKKNLDTVPRDEQ
jgi:RNA polymerase sigma-70 factor (ECF subfamily)